MPKSVKTFGCVFNRAFEMLLAALQSIAFLVAWLAVFFAITNGLLYAAEELGGYAPSTTGTFFGELNNWMPFGGLGAVVVALTIYRLIGSFKDQL